MSDMDQNTLDTVNPGRGMSGMKIFFIVLVTMLITVGVTLPLIK